MLGTGLDPRYVVTFLEFMLAVYSVALVFNTDKKVLKIVHIVLGIIWVVLALLNIFL
ncbi:MAG: hypothetical protein HFG25_06470 [Lachnospiraceae bacterium]|jgi:hypothetical protein|nr:hypothetical protein [Lachnospiraceae bacterium]